MVAGQLPDALGAERLMGGGQELGGEPDPVGDRIVNPDAVQRPRMVSVGKAHQIARAKISWSDSAIQVHSARCCRSASSAR
jgi:hypothetical protein